jgi:hypothetical protein
MLDVARGLMRVSSFMNTSYPRNGRPFSFFEIDNSILTNCSRNDCDHADVCVDSLDRQTEQDIIVKDFIENVNFLIQLPKWKFEGGNFDIKNG